MAKKTPRRLNKKISGLLTGITMAAILILGFLLLRTIEIRQDANRFAEADRIKQAVFDDLIKAIGITPIQIEEKNVCYNSEQGPYDDGRLWCQVASAAYFADLTPQEDIVERFKAAVTGRSYNLLTNGSGDFAFRVAGMSCGLYVYDDILAVVPGYYLPENALSKQTVIVRCSDRAKAKHYPYID